MKEDFHPNIGKKRKEKQIEDMIDARKEWRRNRKLNNTKQNHKNTKTKTFFFP